MSPFEISILILQIVNIVFSLCIGPLITAIVEFSRRIEKSNCFGSSIELTKINELKNEVQQIKESHTKMTESQIDFLTKANYVKKNIDV
jgi:hypothetical protein